MAGWHDRDEATAIALRSAKAPVLVLALAPVQAWAPVAMVSERAPAWMRWRRQRLGRKALGRRR